MGRGAAMLQIPFNAPRQVEFRRRNEKLVASPGGGVHKYFQYGPRLVISAGGKDNKRE
jgi:UPF0288 family protein (methanogenesis marker protein 3)